MTKIDSQSCVQHPTILINASVINGGGSIQVTDSICRDLARFKQYRFVVVLSSCSRNTRKRMEYAEHVKVYEYNMPKNLKTILTGRDEFLDGLVEREHVSAVLTIFGPSRWKPRCPHLQGFARPHLVIPDSPFFQRMPWIDRMKMKFQYFLIGQYFQKYSNCFWTENPYISERLQRLFKGSEVYTVTNYYNQVYDNPEQWKEFPLTKFEGTTLLCISVAYPHKNLPISIEIAEILHRERPNFHFRFVFTVKEEEFPKIPNYLQEHFVFTGPVDITECPSLYQQSSIMFQPTLLECFTATYPEAMKMEVPIVTTDIEFARGLCGDAAVYYSPLSAGEAAKAIYEVATNEVLRDTLTSGGLEQLKAYDTYTNRTEKLIILIERISKGS